MEKGSRPNLACESPEESFTSLLKKKNANTIEGKKFENEIIEGNFHLRTMRMSTVRQDHSRGWAHQCKTQDVAPDALCTGEYFPKIEKQRCQTVEHVWKTLNHNRLTNLGHRMVIGPTVLNVT